MKFAEFLDTYSGAVTEAVLQTYPPLYDSETRRTCGFDLANHFLLHRQRILLLFHHAVGVDVSGGRTAISVEQYLWFRSDHGNPITWCRVGFDVVGDLY